MAASVSPTAGARRHAAIVVAAAAALLAARAAVAVALWRPGWSALTWDDFTRVAKGLEWAGQPFIASPDMVWLPLQTWVYGLGFAFTCDLFADNPMLLAAIVNSLAAVGTAALLGRAAYLLFGSAVGALLTFATALFAPWAVFTSLSALSEPLYYLAVALVVWALAARESGGGLGTVLAGSLGVVAAAANRYEGWLLAPAWLVIVALTLLPRARPTPAAVAQAWWNGRAALAIAAIPLLVPAGWMALHAVRQGSPLAFKTSIAGTFTQAYGAELFGGLAGRLLYYPAGLVRSAPLLVALVIVLAVVAARDVPRSRFLIGLVGLHFVAFYVTSLVGNTVGAFTERFMFAFVLALTPLLGMVPPLLSRVRPRAMRGALAAVVLAMLVAEPAYGLGHSPDEWSHAPDLLAVTTVLGDLARARGAPLRVLVGDGLEHDLMPLHVQNGRLLSIRPAPPVGTDGVVPDADVRIERLPARVAAIPQEPAAIVGRYHLYGIVGMPPSRSPRALGEWRRIDENGVATTMTPAGLVGIEFTGDNPAKGAEARLERLVPRRDRPQRGSLAIRWIYGHGFNLGRMLAEVRVDGRVVFRTDISAPSHWQTVPFEIPAGTGNSTVTLAVRATDRIEPTWSWGRASTVVAKDLTVSPR